MSAAALGFVFCSAAASWDVTSRNWRTLSGQTPPRCSFQTKSATRRSGAQQARGAQKSVSVTDSFWYSGGLGNFRKASTARPTGNRCWWGTQRMDLTVLTPRSLIFAGAVSEATKWMERPSESKARHGHVTSKKAPFGDSHRDAFPPTATMVMELSSELMMML